MKGIFFILIICFMCSACQPIRLDNFAEKVNIDNIKAEDPAPEKIKSDTLSVALCNAKSFCPYYEESELTRKALGLIYEPLFTYDGNAAAVPVLAESAVLSADGMEARVRLKSDVFWHDGSRLTAADVVYTVNVMLSEKSVYSNRYVTGARAVDSKTVVISFSGQLMNASEQLMFPIIKNKNTDKIIGTGPFKFNGRESTDTYSCSTFEKYHGEASKILKLKMIICPDEEAAARMFDIGEVDMLTSNAFENGVAAMSNRAYDYTTNTMVYLGINFEDSVFWGQSTRKALMYAVDKNDIVNRVMYKKAVRSGLPVNPSSLFYDEALDYQKDTKRAEELMLEDSWTRVDGVFARMLDGRMQSFKINMLVQTDGGLLPVGESIKKSLENFGIECTITEAEGTEFEEKFSGREYDIVLAQTELAGASDFGQLTGQNNPFNYFNSELSSVMTAIRTESDTEKLKSLYNTGFGILLNDVQFIPLFFEKNAVAASEKIADNIIPTINNPFFNVSEWTLN